MIYIFFSSFHGFPEIDKGSKLYLKYDYWNRENPFERQYSNTDITLYIYFMYLFYIIMYYLFIFIFFNCLLPDISHIVYFYVILCVFFLNLCI